MPESIEGIRNGSYFLLTYSPAFGKNELWGAWNGITRTINGVTPEQWQEIKHATQPALALDASQDGSQLDNIGDSRQ